jgi:ATP-binding protein involved in chromosome partitioning
MGCQVGIIDLDFACPSVVNILGGEKVYPKEDKGIIPPEIEGIKVMSVTYYSQDEPLPLRGEEVKEIILELLCITRWGRIDFLLIDMPPGMGESILEIVKWMKRIELVVVTTDSKIVNPTTIKMINLIKKMNLKLLGVIKNNTHPYLVGNFKWQNFLGEIPFDKELEMKIGKGSKLRETLFYKTMKNILHF